MDNSPIGVFDSGVGGLSVFSQLIKLLPNENYLYFADTLNLPYGNKSGEELIEITKNIFNFFESKNVKAVVMACNTTSALTYDFLKSRYKFKIYPTVQNVSKQIALQNYKRIGVFATNGTVNSHAYRNQIKKYSQNTEVFEIACPNWVSIAENQLQNTQESISDVKYHLDKMLEYKPDKIILGCTHYPYLMSILSKFTDSEMFIDPAKIFAKEIYSDLLNNELLAEEKNHEPIFYVSSNPQHFIKTSKLFYDVQYAEEINQLDLVCTKKV